MLNMKCSLHLSSPQHMYSHTYILTQARSHTGAMYQVAVDALVFIPIFGVTRKTTVCQVLPLSYTKI